MNWLERKKIFEKYTVDQEFDLSAYSFVSVFLWKDFFEFDFKVMDDFLCVFAQYEAGTFLYLPPLGQELTPAIVQKCFEYLEKHNKHRGVGRIENVLDHQLGVFPAEKFDVYKKSCEYCYLKKDIVEFKGNAFKSKRSDYNKFIKSHSFRLIPFEKKMTKECLTLFEAWAKKRSALNSDIIYNQLLQDNRIVHELALKNFDDLDLIGRVVEVDGQMAAYSFGYPLNSHTFCILFEITDLNFKGLSTYIFREFCKDPALKLYDVINVMDDFELKNIVKTKMSFKPSAMIPSYNVTMRNENDRDR